MNELQKKLKGLKACEETVENAGRFRTAKQAWHGWQIGSDLLWLLVALRLPLKRLKAVLDAVVRQAQEWANGAGESSDAGWAAFLAADAGERAAWANAAMEYWAVTADTADYTARAAADAAAAAGLMTRDEAQAVLADLVRREAPWEEVRELWKGATKKRRKRANDNTTKET